MLVSDVEVVIFTPCAHVVKTAIVLTPTCAPLGMLVLK